VSRGQAARREALARLEQAEAELASLRPMVARQAADNDGLRGQLAEAREALAAAQAAARRADAERQGLASEVRASEAVAARSGATLGSLSTENAGLKREVDALAQALRTAQAEADFSRAEVRTEL
jgi:chromosome segregation ATPase